MARTKTSESIESKIKKAQHKVEYYKENYVDIKGRYVLYRGVTQDVDDIKYVNVEEYLSTLGKRLNNYLEA